MTHVTHRVLIVTCLGLTLAGLSVGLGDYALLDPDEGRNAEVAREMAESNDYVVPRLNGLPYLDKPVVYFAAVAASIEIFGPGVNAARLPSLLFTLATLIVVGWFAWRRLGPHAAWIAVTAAGTAPLTIAFARTVIMDSAATLFMTVALVGFFEAIEGRHSGTGDRRSGGPAVRRSHDTSVTTARPADRLTVGAGWGQEGWTTLAWLAMGVGVLTKGPIAMAVPLMVAVPYAAWRHQLRALASPVAILACVAVILPWVRAVSTVAPDFIGYVLRTETFERLTTDRLQRTGPWWYFLAILPAAAFPWTLAVMAAFRWRRGPVARESGPDHHTVFLVMWVLIPLVFFTLSQSKRPQYVLPLVPALGLLLAHVWTRDSGARLGAQVAGAGLVSLGAALLVVHAAIPSWVRMAPETASAIPDTARWLGAFCVLGGVAAWLLSTHRWMAMLSLSLPAASLPWTSADLMAAVGRERSAAELARAIQPVLSPETQVVAVRTYPLSLPFYLGRILVVSTESGSELTSNYLTHTVERWRGVPGSTLRPSDWWREALADCSRPRVFVVASRDLAVRQELEARLPLLVETERHAAYGPCGRSDLAMKTAAQGQPDHPHPNPTAQRHNGSPALATWSSRDAVLPFCLSVAGGPRVVVLPRAAGGRVGG